MRVDLAWYCIHARNKCLGIFAHKANNTDRLVVLSGKLLNAGC